MFKQSNKGFTIIELLIFVIIIGVLAVIIIPQFGGSAERDKENQVRDFAHAVQLAVEDFYVQNHTYPTYKDVNKLTIVGQHVHPKTGEKATVQPLGFKAYCVGYGYDPKTGIYTIEIYGQEGLLRTLTNG